MDPNTIDRLARLVGSGQSRRQVLKSIAGGAAGAVAAAVGLNRAGAAARCRPQGVVCSKNADCCSVTCLPKDRTGRRVCAECGTASDCPAGDQCQTATCTGGACGFEAKPNGTLCDDGNDTTCTDVCTDGICSGGACLVGDVCSPNGCTCHAGDPLSPLKRCNASAPCDLTGSSLCACDTNTDGVTGCWDYCVPCFAAAPCTSTADCTAYGADAVCVSTFGCDGNICVRPCGGGGIVGETSLASASTTSTTATLPLGPN